MSRQLRSNMNAADKAELDSNFRRITNAPPVNQSALIAALPLSTSSSPVDFIPDSSGFRPIVPQTAITFYDVVMAALYSGKNSLCKSQKDQIRQNSE